jgi:hypothetical protein
MNKWRPLGPLLVLSVPMVQIPTLRAPGRVHEIVDLPDEGCLAIGLRPLYSATAMIPSFAAEFRCCCAHMAAWVRLETFTFLRMALM